MRLAFVSVCVIVAVPLCAQAQSDGERFAEARYALDKEKNCGQAKLALEGVSESTKANPAWIMYMARTYECTLELEKAVTLYQKYFETIQPPPAEILDKIGELRYRIRQRDTANQHTREVNQSIERAMAISDLNERFKALLSAEAKYAVIAPGHTATAEALAIQNLDKVATFLNGLGLVRLPYGGTSRFKVTLDPTLACTLKIVSTVDMPDLDSRFHRVAETTVNIPAEASPTFTVGAGYGKLEGKFGSDKNPHVSIGGTEDEVYSFDSLERWRMEKKGETLLWSRRDKTPMYNDLLVATETDATFVVATLNSARAVCSRLFK